ncbi:MULTISPECIES: phosphatidylserine decarboxylase [unclassified Sphingomonas]|jgi:phosphatidylserine decarboxylase|uniref:phosphatidylserine decarboxylase n=1 Tax=unclassified Sphingomonas TaxID=196159 RepID=UPI00082AB7BD|nr:MULTISPECIES: phosphatidylserine decarboxylase [unclassified Sphingomonas]MCH4892641.1 phosphatidylserine decarboxylase [Sphingomonas sp. SFZ2018-12]
MGSLEKPPVVTTTVKWRWPGVHPEGHRYIALSLGVAFVAWLFLPALTWPLIIFTLWVAAFFRDPVRVTPQGEGLIVSPADGLVTMIERVALPPELRGPRGLGEAPLVRVSIFMSVFDVHINRTPISGTVREVVYISGKFLNADLDKASEENERQHIVVEGRDGVRVGFTQIAGLLARRIVGFVKPGDIVVGGQRIGLIRFGSRVDVFLPEGFTPQVALGQRAVAGETVIGRPALPPARGLAQ